MSLSLACVIHHATLFSAVCLKLDTFLTSGLWLLPAQQCMLEADDQMHYAASTSAGMCSNVQQCKKKTVKRKESKNSAAILRFFSFDCFSVNKGRSVAQYDFNKEKDITVSTATIFFSLQRV